MSSQTLTAILCVFAGIMLCIQSFSNFRILSPKNEKMFKRVSQKALRVYYGIFGVLFLFFGCFTLFMKVN
jgi:threonine/homoserine/homoserine lactone efflux protein